MEIQAHITLCPLLLHKHRHTNMYIACPSDRDITKEKQEGLLRPLR